VVSRPDPSCRTALADLVRSIPEFDPADVQVALELIDAALAGSADYQLLLDVEDDGRLRGYVCFGPTPMTRSTWDLYWIAVHPRWRRQGVAGALVARLEAHLRARGARLIRVETASNEAYEPTRAFYDRVGYKQLARIPDFYKEGDDLIVYGRRLF